MPEVVVTFRAENEEAVIRAFNRVTRTAQTSTRRTATATEALTRGQRRVITSTNFLNRTLQATNGLLATAGQRIASRVFVVGAAIAFVRVLAEIQQGFQAIVAEGFRFNRQLEQNAIALTAIIGSTRELAIANGETIAAIMFYPILLAAARARQREILFLSIETLGTAEDLTGVYQRILSFTSTQAATDNERLTLASNLLNISRLIGLNAAETLIEIRQLTTLDNQRGQAVLQVLGLNIQQLRNWKEQGVLVQRLNDALEPIRAIGREIGQSFQGVFESVRSLIGIVTGETFVDVFRGALDVLRGMRDRLREISEEGGLAQIVNISPEQLEQFGRRLGDAIVTISQHLARLTADFIEFTAQNPGFIDGLLAFLGVLELTIRGTVTAIANIFGIVNDVINLLAPATSRLADVAANQQGGGAGNRRNVSPGEELIAAIRALPEGALVGSQGLQDPETLERISTNLSSAGGIFFSAVEAFTDGVKRDASERARLLNVERASDLFVSRETIDLFSEALQQQTVTTEDALNKIVDVLIDVPAEVIRRTDTAQAFLSPASSDGPLGDLRDLFTADTPISRPRVDLDRVTNFFAETSRDFARTVRFFQTDARGLAGAQGFGPEAQEAVRTFTQNFPTYLREAGLALIENAIPILITTATGFAAGSAAGGPIGAVAGTALGGAAGFALAGQRFGQRLDAVEARRIEEAQLTRLGSPEGLEALTEGFNTRLTRLNEILDAGFQDLTLPEVASRQAEIVTIREELAPFQEQARRLIAADPSLVTGGEEAQRALSEGLTNVDEFLTRFVSLLQTRVRSLEEANRAAITLERQYAQAIAGQVQARFQIGLGSPQEFIDTQINQVEAVRRANLARVDTNAAGQQTAADLARFQTQNVFAAIPGLVGQQAQFNIREESAAIEQITQARQTQLSIQMQAEQSALSLIGQERQFIDVQRTSLQEQTTLLEREGTLRQQQLVTTRENLTLQANDRAARLEVLERELAQTSGAISTSRRQLLATEGGVDVGAIEEFDQTADITLNNIIRAIANLNNELGVLNGSIVNTQAAAELLANQTARDVRQLTANRPDINLANQQEQANLALATLQRATAERQSQLDIRNRERSIVLQTIASDLSYLQSRDSGLREQIELITLRGQLQTAQAEAELESLRLQRFEAQERLDIANEQLNLYTQDNAIARQQLEADPATTDAEILSFDANAAVQLNDLRDITSGLVIDIDRVNVAFDETGARIRQVGIDTTRAINDISNVTLNLGSTIREALNQFSTGLARGTADVSDLFSTLADSIHNSFTSAFTEALTAKFDFDIVIEKNLTDLSGLFKGFGSFIGRILTGVFGAASTATTQFGRNANQAIGGITLPAAGTAAAPAAPTAAVPAAPEATPTSAAITQATSAVVGSAENAAASSANASQAANQAAQAAGATVAVTAQAQVTILSGFQSVVKSLLGLGQLIALQIAPSIGAAAGGGSGEARTGAQIGNIAGSIIGKAVAVSVSTSFMLAGTALGSVLGPIGSIAGGLIGSLLGGLIGGLFAPGRIALEKRAIRGELSEGLSFEPEFGSGYVGTDDPDRRALESIGALRAIEEIRKNDERGQGTVQRYVNQAIHAFENANLTREQRQEEIFRLAQQTGFDNPISVLQSFRSFDREHGLDEIVESRDEGLAEGNLITRVDLIAGAIDIYSQFDERINAVAVANNFLADALAKVRPEAVETIAGVRDGSILLEDALIMLGVAEGEIGEAFDGDLFLRYLQLAQIGVDALRKEVEDLTLALEGIEFTRAELDLQRVRTLQEIDGARAIDEVPFLRRQGDVLENQAQLEESRIIPADELDFTNPDEVDASLRAIERAEAARMRQIQNEIDIFRATEQEVQDLAQEEIDAAEELAKMYSDLADEQTEFASEANESARAATEAARGASEAARDASRAAQEAAKIADLFVDAAEAARDAIGDLLSSISTLPENEARLQREAADIQNELAGNQLSPEERADAFRRLTDIQQQRGQLFLEDDPLGNRGRVLTDVIPELQDVEDRAREEELPFRSQAEAAATSAAAFAAEAAQYEAQAAAFTAEAAAFTAEATRLELLATEALESAAGAYERIAEEFGLEDLRAQTISNVEELYASISRTLDILEAVVRQALLNAQEDERLLLTGSVDETPGTNTELPGTGAQEETDRTSGGAAEQPEPTLPADTGLPPGANQRRSDGLIQIGIGSFVSLPSDQQDRIRRYNAAIGQGGDPGPFIEFAQTGFQGTVREPTLFQTGEGGFPEDVIIRPRRLGGLLGGDNEGGDADGQLPGGETRIAISIDLRGATGISATEVAEMTVERLLDAFREDLRTGKARQIVREEIL